VNQGRYQFKNLYQTKGHFGG